jgi:hypothetical protein
VQIGILEIKNALTGVVSQLTGLMLHPDDCFEIGAVNFHRNTLLQIALNVGWQPLR